MSDSVRPHGRQPTRLPCPWDSPGKNTGVGCHFLLQCVKVKSESEVAQSCPTPSDPMDCSPPGSSVHGIFQARVLEWGAIAFSDKTLAYSIKKYISWKRGGGERLKRKEIYIYNYDWFALMYGRDHIIVKQLSSSLKKKKKERKRKKGGGGFWVCQFNIVRNHQNPKKCLLDVLSYTVFICAYILLKIT